MHDIWLVGVLDRISSWRDGTDFAFYFDLVSCIGVVWKTYSIPQDWTVGNELLRHTLGVVRLVISLFSALVNNAIQLLVALHIWATKECFQVLGLFGMLSAC